MLEGSKEAYEKFKTILNIFFKDFALYAPEDQITEATRDRCLEVIHDLCSRHICTNMYAHGMSKGWVKATFQCDDTLIWILFHPVEKGQTPLMDVHLGVFNTESVDTIDALISSVNTVRSLAGVDALKHSKIMTALKHKMQDMPADYAKLVNEHFWDLV